MNRQRRRAVAVATSLLLLTGVGAVTRGNSWYRASHDAGTSAGNSWYSAVR